jgi:hypothetical protein
MTDIAAELVRRQIDKLLRADYPDRAFCAFCLEKLVLNIFGTGLPKAKAERTVDEVFESPGAITRLPAVGCSQCGKTTTCLVAPSA